MNTSVKCPLTGLQASYQTFGDARIYQTDPAGIKFKFSGTAEALLNVSMEKNSKAPEPRRLAFWVCREILKGNATPYIDDEVVKTIKQPEVAERLNTYILWAGKQIGDDISKFIDNCGDDGGKIALCASSGDDASNLVNDLFNKGQITATQIFGPGSKPLFYDIRLTNDGWAVYADLSENLKNN